MSAVMGGRAAVLAAMGLVVACVSAQAQPQPAAPAASAASAPVDHSSHHAGADMASAEVRRIDKAAGKVTLRHGEIKSLDMPPMTMVFQVPDLTLLDRVKVGDKVRFRADLQGGTYRVIELQLAP